MRDLLRRLLGWKATVVAPVVTELLDIQTHAVPAKARLRGMAAGTRLHAVPAKTRLYHEAWSGEE